MYRLILFIALVCLSLSAIAQGDLLVAPMRVIMEGKEQKEILYLSNTGNEAASYSISFIQYVMKEDGSFMIVDKPDSSLMVATPFIRIFPRKVTLAPGESQSVMLQLRRGANMVSGEYRSHLYFRSEKNDVPLGIKNSAKDSGISVRIIPIYGISIPIILRIGATNVSATLSDLRLAPVKDTVQNLAFTINRIGNISTYGDIKVEFIPKQGKPYEVGMVKGIGVYTTTSRRFITLPLKDKEKRALKDGKLKVQYVCAEESKYNVYAESELDI